MNKKKILISISLLSTLLILVVFSSVYFTQAKDNISEEFQISKDTLVRYLGNEEMVVVPDSVKVIGTAAFEGNDSIKRVILPSGLTEIQYNAFAEMDNLERIVIQDNVTKIGPSAFANCGNLEYVYIGKSLTELDQTPFTGCDKLENVEISDKNTSYTCVDGVIYNADRTTIVEVLPGRQKNFYIVPDQVQTISAYAFYGCNNLEYLALPDSVVDISAYSIANAYGLKSVTMSFNTTSISMKAFENCTSLEQVQIPDSVKFIHENAFDGCTKVSIYTSVGTKAEEYGNENDIPVIYEPKIALDIATTEREKLVEKRYEEKAKENEEKPMYDLEKDDSLGATFIVNGQAVVIMDPSSLKVNSKEETVESKNEASETQTGNDTTFGNNESDHSSIPEDYIIPDNLFYKDKDLKTIDIPETTKEIGKFSFARSGLRSIIIPEGVETIRYGAFYHCDNLSEVVIPSTVKTIEAKAFDNTKWLEDWYKYSEDDYLIVGDGVLLAYKGDKKDYIKPDNVKYVSCVIE